MSLLGCCFCPGEPRAPDKPWSDSLPNRLPRTHRETAVPHGLFRPRRAALGLVSRAMSDLKREPRGQSWGTRVQERGAQRMGPLRAGPLRPAAPRGGRAAGPVPSLWAARLARGPSPAVRGWAPAPEGLAPVSGDPVLRQCPFDSLQGKRTPRGGDATLPFPQTEHGNSPIAQPLGPGVGPSPQEGGCP